MERICLLIILFDSFIYIMTVSSDVFSYITNDRNVESLHDRKIFIRHLL